MLMMNQKLSIDSESETTQTMIQNKPSKKIFSLKVSNPKLEPDIKHLDSTTKIVQQTQILNQLINEL